MNMVGKKKKPLYYKQTKHKASISHALYVSQAALCIQCRYFLPKTNLNTIWRVNQDCSEFCNTLKQQEISSLSLKQDWHLLAFLFLASPVNHCAISVTQTLILQTLACNKALTQSFKGRCWRNQGLKSSGCQFPICTVMEFFPPCRMLRSVCMTGTCLTTFT